MKMKLPWYPRKCNRCGGYRQPGEVCERCDGEPIDNYRIGEPGDLVHERTGKPDLITAEQVKRAGK